MKSNAISKCEKGFLSSEQLNLPNKKIEIQKTKSITIPFSNLSSNSVISQEKLQ